MIPIFPYLDDLFYPITSLIPLFTSYILIFIVLPGSVFWAHALYYRYLDVSNGDDFGTGDWAKEPPADAHEQRFAKFFAAREKRWF